MDLFSTLEELRFGRVHVAVDEKSGMRAIIALHSTKFGPAIGGCRCIPYPSTDAAMRDALRLARGMSYKAAISNLPHGGGKAVIMLPTDRPVDRGALFSAFGRFVDSLDGVYLTSEDSGTSPRDMDVVARHTRHVLGSSGGSGDPSPWTALGVLRGIEAAVAFQKNRKDLGGMHVAIQGVGHVGTALARLLHERGVRLTVADTSADNVRRVVDELGATAVAPSEILSVECDVLAPCALGAVINDETVGTLRTSIVAGAANNQLGESRHGIELFRRGILYAPDYAINAGGLISVANEYAESGWSADRVRTQVEAIHDTLLGIFTRARSEDRPTFLVADTMVEEKLFA